MQQIMILNYLLLISMVLKIFMRIWHRECIRKQNNITLTNLSLNN